MFVFRLEARRATFALDMGDEEREIMGRHIVHRRPYLRGDLDPWARDSTFARALRILRVHVARAYELTGTRAWH